MSTISISKQASKFVTVTKAKTITTVKAPVDEVVQVVTAGVSGPANVIAIGTVTTGPAAATITGTAPNQILNLVLPTGGSYVHNQSVSASTWTITHNLNYYPGGVSVIDSGETVVVGDITHLSTNSFTVSFSTPFSGKVYVS
jgi:hypothetical protein